MYLVILDEYDGENRLSLFGKNTLDEALQLASTRLREYINAEEVLNYLTSDTDLNAFNRAHALFLDWQEMMGEEYITNIGIYETDDSKDGKAKLIGGGDLLEITWDKQTPIFREKRR